MIVISRTVLFFIVFVATFSVSFAQMKYHQVTLLLTKEFTVSDASALGVELDHGAKISENQLTCIVNDYLLDTLRSLNVIIDIEKYDLAKMYAQRIADEKRTHSQYSTVNSKKLYGSMGNFLTLEEIYEIFTELIDKYPTLIQSEQIGTTFENRPIYAFHIGEDTVKNSQSTPRTLVTSLHHAREAITATITSFFVQDFFEKVANQDPFSLYVLKHSPITIIPCLNPDGYEYNRSTNANGGGMWRKNRRKLSSNNAFGVDPNRNYGPKEFWDSPNGGSATIGNSDTYRGDSAFSEAETQAMRFLLEKYNIKSALNFHSFSDLIVTPVSYSSNHPPDDTTFHYFCAHHTTNTRYPFGRDIQMVNYPARGSSDDYLYLGTSKKVIAITPEVGNSSDGFWPTRSRIFPLVQTNLPSIYTAIRSTMNLPYLYSYSNSEVTDIGNSHLFTLEFVNTSLQSTKPCSIIYSKLNPNSQSSIDTKTDSLFSIPVSGRQKITFIAQGGVRPPLSGNNDGIIIEQRYDGFSLYDTLYIAIQYRNDYGLYNGESSVQSVPLKGWEIEFDDEDSTYSLTESVRSNTQPNQTLTTQTAPTISLEGCVEAYIEFDSRWDFEANGDGAIVFFFDNDSVNVTPLRTERTINFTNGNSNLFPIRTPYLSGRFSQRIVQRASLNRFLGRSGRIGFQVRSNGGVTYDGFNLYSAKLVTFTNSSTSTLETSNQQIIIQDAYNTMSFSLIRAHKPFNPIVDFSIYSINGALMYNQQYEWGSQNYKGISIFKDVFPSGVYFVSVTIDGKTIQEPFTVVR